MEYVFQLIKNLISMLVQKWRRPANRIGVNESRMEIRRGVAADDRMLDLLKPLARPKLFTRNELSHCVERGGGEMTPLRLLGKFLGGKLADEMGGLRHFRGVRVSVS